MVDRAAQTLPPPDSAERDLDAEHRKLIEVLFDSPDPKVRILAHMSNRQFELSERLTTLERMIADGFASLNSKVDQMGRDLGDKIDVLDDGFKDVEDRTTSLEKLNGSSSQAVQQQ